MDSLLQNHLLLKNIIIYLGFIILIKKIYSFLCVVFKYFFPFPVNDLKSKYGDGYVIITGGSTGIGLGFANEFLKQKYKLLLISSNLNKLQNAKNQLQLKHPNSKIEILAYDLNRPFDDKILEDLDKKISNIINNEEISILFNNAGIAIRKKLENHSISEIN